jgi:vacuolar-type H+-ATPase subunit D/Vma8
MPTKKTYLDLKAELKSARAAAQDGTRVLKEKLRSLEKERKEALMAHNKTMATITKAIAAADNQIKALAAQVARAQSAVDTHPDARKGAK